MIEKIISGAQTGADRAGLDAAIVLGLDVGGWIPRGGLTENGNLTPEEIARYKLTETRTTAYVTRTRANVHHSDGTVIFGVATSPGSAKTSRLCEEMSKPVLVISEVTLAAMRVAGIGVFRNFLKAHDIRTLNVAGNRESRNPGIYDRTLTFLLDALIPELGQSFEMYGEKTPQAALEKLARMRAAVKEAK